MRQHHNLMTIVGFGLLLWCGCSAVSKGPKELDETARNLTPPADKALIYILRPDMFRGGKVGMEVNINGITWGKTGGKRYLFAIVEPGYYYIESRAGNYSDMAIHVGPGRTYYIKQEIVDRKSLLRKAGNTLVLLRESFGRQLLGSCALSGEMANPVTPGVWTEVASTQSINPYLPNASQQRSIGGPPMPKILDLTVEQLEGKMHGLSQLEVTKGDDQRQVYEFNTLGEYWGLVHEYRLTDGFVFLDSGIVVAWSRSYE